MYAKANEQKSPFSAKPIERRQWVDDETNEEPRKKSGWDFCTCRARFEWPQQRCQATMQRRSWHYGFSLSLSTIWSGEAINKSGNFQLVILDFGGCWTEMKTINHLSPICVAVQTTSQYNNWWHPNIFSASIRHGSRWSFLFCKKTMQKKSTGWIMTIVSLLFVVTAAPYSVRPVFVYCVLTVTMGRP